MESIFEEKYVLCKTSKNIEGLRKITSVKAPDKTITVGLGQMAQMLRALAVLVEKHSSVPSTHMLSYNLPYLQFQELWCPLLASKGTRHACNAWPFMKIKHSYP